MVENKPAILRKPSVKLNVNSEYNGSSVSTHGNLSMTASSLQLLNSFSEASVPVLRKISLTLLSIVKAWVGEIPRMPYVSMERLHTARCHVIAASSTCGTDA